MKRFLSFVFFSVLTVSVQAQSLPVLNKQQKQLEKQQTLLKGKIEQLNTHISQQESSKHDVLDELKEAEKAISTMVKKVTDLSAKERLAQQELSRLKQAERKQQALLEEQLQELAEQVKTVYMSGVSPWATLLSGKDVHKIGRELGYLGYISRSRAMFVANLEKDIERLRLLRQKAQDKQKELTQLNQEAKKAQKALEKEQKSYQVSLKKIELDLKKRRQEAKKLNQDDQRLSRLMEGIEKNILQQRQALWQAQQAQEKQAQEHHQALARERVRQEQLAERERQLAQRQLEKAKQLRESAHQQQKEALNAQRLALRQQEQVQLDVDKAQQAFRLGSLTLEQQEEAKKALQQALKQQEMTQTSLKKAEEALTQARQLVDEAEIERAKAKLIKEKAIESEKLLEKTEEDERLARVSSTQTGLRKGAPWPLRGALLGKFGQTRPDTGDVWRGILINANEGDPVKAVASGQVVFANWVRGFGNLIIVDHANNYFSIYGYNQSLVRSVGDSVQAGEVLAKAGATGGQVEPALYFEIRQGSQVLDPLLWLTR